MGSQFRYDVVASSSDANYTKVHGAQFSLSTASSSDANYTKIHGAQFSLSTVGNMCKWAATHQSQDAYNLTKCVQSFEYALSKNQQFRGHNLCWGNDNPKWLTEKNWTQTELQTILEDHVTHVMKGLESHGDVYAWVRNSLSLSSVALSYLHTHKTFRT